MTTRRIGVDERRARLARRHHVTAGNPASDVAEVADDLVALHSTDPATVYLAVAARMDGVKVEAIEQALYEDRSVVRMLGMRRTMFVVPTELVPVVHSACTHDIAAKERRRLVQFLEDNEVATDCAAWLEGVEEATVAALNRRGEAFATELSKDIPELGRPIVVGQGTKWATTVRASTRVLFQLAADGRIVRGRPRGSWISSQYRWAPVESWLPGGVHDIPIAGARAELARRWLAAYGPGTIADLKWWTGWTVAHVKQALAQIDTVDVDLEGAPGLVLAGHDAPVDPPEPWVALLPALDPTVMGWTERAWYLGDHRRALFDRSGNPGPTVWCDGRIVGGWAQRKDGAIVHRLLEEVGADALTAIDAAAAELATWLGPTRFTPRFRAPLERELSA